ncbi:MAG: large conductance mechanosensitive channel protein MscL [Propionibacteriales bacterium]|nr:large conductance mechanosensitive channel protein MscL [Propionibacteriales bacterium]
MQGFKEFLLRGNLVELAVAFIIGTAFAAVVTAFTGLVLSIIAAIVGTPEVGKLLVGPAGHQADLAPFINAVISFVIVGAVVYFLVVLPYNKFKERKKIEEPEAAATSEDLLVEIRDLLKTR